jgi:hypothetical protein
LSFSDFEFGATITESQAWRGVYDLWVIIIKTEKAKTSFISRRDPWNIKLCR